MKHLLFLIFAFLCIDLSAENCDSTFQLFKTIRTIGIDRDAKYPEELKRLEKECILDILDSINDNNYYRIVHIITMYYVFIEPDVCKNVYVEKIDSAIIAKISYGLSNKNLKIAEEFREHLGITKQFSWILQRDSLARKSLQEYVVNHNGNVNRGIVSYISEIRDSVSFWLVYQHFKDERKNYGSDLRYLIYCGMENFGYYDLFLENTERLSNLGWTCMVSKTLHDEIINKCGYDVARKAYSKLILNKDLMQSRSSSDVWSDITPSVFKEDFSSGIEIFYPKLAKTDEYINSCMNPPKYCEFDKRLYDLLVKTIKSEYKDLK
jgi:hypothetical protein